eukprot:CAMPEP_0171461670 /NCGR_PEP_ID=MMETSP0945-20130129/6022_1 /TAXON_ID=109269 /ORGANISM="Vaucheria litorea, Strain CCMP2940" /LENGTH=459 /DNA_ID=CAMNT_0011988057 /DNA_START=146 /DNA_END=1525 /DNA_ORIENTATION=+
MSTEHVEKADEMTTLVEENKTNCFWEIFTNYWPLPFISFGGPPMHVALFHDKFVNKNEWLSDRMFAEIFAISASLPGPASTQLGYTVALIRSGVCAAIFAFLIWSVPGALFLALLGSFVGGTSSSDLPDWVLFVEDGLASAAVALVAMAAFNLANKLCVKSYAKVIALIVFCFGISFQEIHWLSPVYMIFGGLLAFLKHRCDENKSREKNHIENGNCEPTKIEEAEFEGDDDISFSYSRSTGYVLLLLWLALLFGAILLKETSDIMQLQLLSTFFYVGSIIFGGGPVVIPLLYTYVVVPGWADSSSFLLGLAVINSMPGPNFNFAAFCGALVMRPFGFAQSLLGAVIAWFGIFCPGLMVKTGILPLWRHYRGFPLMQKVFEGVNAAAVGLVFTATFQLSQKALAIKADGTLGGPFQLGSEPIFVAVAAVTFVGVRYMSIPPPIAVVGGGVVGLAQYFVH